MGDPVNSTSPESKKPPTPILISDDDADLTDDVKARSCCGCIFFFFTLWIWFAVFVGLFLDELATRQITISGQNVTLKCGWQARTYRLNDKSTVDNYGQGSAAQRAGLAYFVSTLFIAPFLVLLTLSFCVRNGTKDESPEDSFHPNRDLDVEEKERWDRSQRFCNNLNRSFKIFGMLGTFILSIVAYSPFSNAIGDCSSLPSTATAGENPTIGRTMQLLISAVVIASILILVVIVLIVLLTSENADQIGFVGAIVKTMACFGCDQGCPECNGGLDCNDAGADSDALCGATDNCCCCCAGN